MPSSNETQIIHTEEKRKFVVIAVHEHLVEKKSKEILLEDNDETNKMNTFALQRGETILQNVQNPEQNAAANNTVWKKKKNLGNKKKKSREV